MISALEMGVINGTTMTMALKMSIMQPTISKNTLSASRKVHLLSMVERVVNGCDVHPQAPSRGAIGHALFRQYRDVAVVGIEGDLDARQG